MQRSVKKRFFFGRFGKAKPLLDEVDAQHGLQGKRWLAVPAFGVIRRCEADQLGPRNDLLHLFEELAFTDFFAVQNKVQCGLFYAMYFIAKKAFHTETLKDVQNFPKEIQK